MNKIDFIRKLAKMRIQNDPMAANFDIKAEDLDYLTDTMLLGLPEATIVTIVEIYWKIKEKENIDNKTIFEYIEKIRTASDEAKINLPQSLTMFNYIKYRLNKEHSSYLQIDDDFLKEAIYKTNQFFNKTYTQNENIEKLKEAFRGVCELFKRQNQKITEEQRAILFMSIDKIKPQIKEYLPKLNIIYKIMFNGFFKCAADGYAFVSENMIKKHYGKSLIENYPSNSSPAFMKLATSYWTLKILHESLFPRYKKIMIYQLLGKLESELAEYFFPSPGPYMMDLRKMEVLQREVLLKSNSNINIDEFISGNPLLKFPQTERSSRKTNHHTKNENSVKSSNFTKSKSISTRWLSFYIYIFLPFKILVSPVNILASYYDGNINFNILDFVPILTFDIFLIFLIYGLHKRKFWGWICNWIFLAFMVLLSPISSSNNFRVYIVAVILTALIFFLPNYIYFKKRKYLFK